MQVLSRKSIINCSFAASLAIFAAIGYLAYEKMEAVQETDVLEHHTHVVVHELDLLLTALVDAETGQRGYLITRNQAYLEPYNSALGRVATKQQTLRALTRDYPDQQKRLDRMDALIHEKLAVLKLNLALAESKGLQAAGQRIVSQLDTGKRVMDEFRAVVFDAQAAEQRILKERSAAKKEEIARTLQVVKGGGVVGFLILVGAFLSLTTENAQRTRAEQVLKSRNDELEQSRDRERSQNWIKSGLNELGSKLRGDMPLEEMGGTALAFISGYVRAGVGVVYLFDSQDETLRIIASYAFTRDKTCNRVIRLGEGLAGEAAREMKPLSLHQVPPDYLVVGSALGEAVPRLVTALPLVHDNRLIGVMELGTLRDFSEAEFQFLSEAAEELAVAISVNGTRQKVNDLLIQSQSQEEELRVQQEELQQSNEELEERAQLLEQQREQIQAKNREMEQAARELARNAREIQQISTYKSEFLANMSHELRTPLNSLMILSAHLQENREGTLTPKQVEYAATINGAGNELLVLINDILDLSKIEAGRLEFIFAETRLAELCEQVSGLFSPLAEQKELKFGTTIEAGLRETACLDAQRTLQVLKNLISNAIKFTRNGSVHLHIYAPPSAENPLAVPAVAFSVTDTGIGIPTEKQEIIFQAFQQADGSTSRKYGGTGLGLSISRQLARGMSGEILVRSGQEQGSVFTLYLPVTPATTAPAALDQAAPSPLAPSRELHPETLSSPEDRAGIPLKEGSILVMENDPDLARLLLGRVSERGFRPILATDGVSGIQLAEKLQPAAILLDVMLPEGWEVMRKLSENMRVRHIPVHLITSIEDRQKALAMGGIGLITNPVQSEELEQVLATVEERVSRTVQKLLIVEDDRIHAAALVALLEERGIALTVAETGAEAIRLLPDTQFDCIVLDLGLADMSGFDLLEQIRKMDETRRVPVIVHTGRDLAPEETLRLQHFAESIIIKGTKSAERLLNEVTLFLHGMEGTLPPQKQHQAGLATETLLTGKKVLLVDDDMRNIFSLSSVLLDKGMQVVEAENGRVALARLEEHPDVDLVMMDVMMPEMDGYEATRRIRQDQRYNKVPIIALTAKAMKGDREECLKAGASDYITKPVDTQRLLSLLRVWLYQNV